jgi:hypothetical protein
MVYAMFECCVVLLLKQMDGRVLAGLLVVVIDI